MRILIDLQGAQGISRNRGIGRYSLSLALGIARNRGAHEVFIALNDLFPQTIEPIRVAFRGVLPRENILVWRTEGRVAASDPANAVKQAHAEALREAFFASLQPDFIVITSLFEGFSDDCVTSVNKFNNIPTAVVLYDLIPLIRGETYLSNDDVKFWYLHKIENLKRAKLLLAISSSAAQEAIEHLEGDASKVFNISAASDAQFAVYPPTQSQLAHLREKYGIIREFVMYTGGIDPRKNIDRLIRAYGLLPKMLRRKYQLAIVCAVRPEEREALKAVSVEAGLDPDELVVTGYLPDADLITSYNACTAFIMPSLHEGFGLPALEAMKCGRAVIASDTSSLPEVVGRSDALFDPHDELAISEKLKQVLEDERFRAELERHSLEQSARFSWDASAQRAIAAISDAVSRHRATKPLLARRRKRLAYVSPLPPKRSGISAYSVQLLPELQKWYDIDLIVDQPEVVGDAALQNMKRRDVSSFRENAREYDRVLYQFGNSAFHESMFKLLEEAPGVIVLHDFFLSGINDFRGRNAMAQALKDSHGYHAVVEHLVPEAGNSAVWKYPTNLPVLQNALGVIVHSEYSRRLADLWYGKGSSADWIVIPHLRVTALDDSGQRATARARIGVPDSSLLLCSFGFLAQTKLNDRLISAFLQSKLAADSNVHMVFVGENEDGEYGAKISDMIRKCGLEERIRITGWADTETFDAYLRAADIAIQLRSLSRGETSGAVLDCMNRGLATVVNANGAMADLDRTSVFMLNDQFDDEELIATLEKLAADPVLRHAIGMKGQDVIRSFHSPEYCAAQYAEAIELFHTRDENGLGGLVREFSTKNLPVIDAKSLSSTLAENFPPRPRLRQLLVDISELVKGASKTNVQRMILRRWLTNPPDGWLVEPVFASEDRRGFYYARRFTCDFLEINDSWVEDAVVDAWSGDLFVGLGSRPEIVLAQQTILDAWHRAGVDIRFTVYALQPVLRPNFFTSFVSAAHAKWLKHIMRFDGAICISEAVAKELRDWRAEHAPSSPAPFQIDWFGSGADSGQSRSACGKPDCLADVLRKLLSMPNFP